MRRVLVAALAGFALACSEPRQNAGLPSEPQSQGGPAPQVAPTPGTCTTIANLKALANAAF